MALSPVEAEAPMLAGVTDKKRAIAALASGWHGMTDTEVVERARAVWVRVCPEPPHAQSGSEARHAPTMAVVGDHFQRRNRDTVIRR
jgi:hypothetical protein